MQTTTLHDSILLFQLRKNKSRVMEEDKCNNNQSSVRNGNSSKRGGDSKTILDISLYKQPPQSDNFIIQVFYNFIHATFVVLSKFRFGQFMITALDHYMAMISDILDFCCPDYVDFADPVIIEKHQSQLSKENKPVIAWIFLISTLIFLRILRFTLSIYCIIYGKGEVTAQEMQNKIIAFRNYYRSISYFAVNQWSEEEKKAIEEKCTESIFWRFYYRVYEVVFMTKPRVAQNPNNDEQQQELDDSTEVAESSSKVNSDKKSLNVSSSSSTSSADSDDELNPIQLMEKYVDMDSSADPDYKPNKSNLDSTIDSTLGTDEERDKTESQLDEDDEEDQKNNTYSSDMERNKTEKSNDSISNSLTAAQMNELEKEIMSKILSYFQENRGFPSFTDSLSETFYSPIGSPPGKPYSSDSEVQHSQQQQQ